MKAKLNPTLRQVSLAVLIALTCNSVMAEEEILPEYTFMDAIKTGKNLSSFRLRYEHVQQDGNQAGTGATTTKALADADAITLRSLVGWQTAPYKNFSFALQVINVTKLQDDYNDSTYRDITTGATNDVGRVAYAKIVDPDQTNINQVYVDWTGIKNTRFRLGRQQTNLDNVRFVGDIGFRQVMQVFDGVSVLTKAIPNTDVYLAHFEGVNQINTRDRQDGALNILNAKYYITPTESITGYAYLSSFKDLGFGNAWFGAGNATANQSNKVIGARLDGIHPFTPNLRAVYTAEYANQTDYSGGDKRIDAHYYKVGGGVGIDFLTLRVDQELLSSNNGNYGFQTPFGTNHLFQGWVDKFLTTPKNGIEDTFATATYRMNDVLFFADYHIYKADKDFARANGGRGDKYGTEWNVAVTYNYDKNIMGKVEYGKYSEADQYLAATSRIRDTEKLWLTAMYSF